MTLSGASALCVMVLLSGCTPAPITDEQAALTTQRCRELGMATAIFNSGIVSRVQCVPIINNIPVNP